LDHPNIHVGSAVTNIQDRLQNVNVASSDLLATPEEVKKRVPLTARAAETVFKSRELVRAILERRDPRLFVVVGPCSIHDVAAAREYADRLKVLADQIGSTLLPIMRVYFEKPRTTVGWKGLINDPDLDDSFHIEKGILLARELLLYVAELGLPAGTEALDPIMPQYLSELITWTAIGARTTESQTHREMASGLSTPVGFKNGTDGALSTSINALQSVRHPHHFLGITQQGQSAVFRTRGNAHAHLVLRGGGGRANYDAVSIAVAERELAAAGLPATIVVDCSHGNSNKDPSLQPLVAENCVAQIVDGNRSIVGLMLESHLKAGNQAIPKDLSQLEYGLSITDPCIDWQTTEDLLLKLHRSLLTVKR
jgi:3-deoxy-7-phosphoheptulonate synthase